MITGTEVINYDGVDFLILFNGDAKWYIAKQIADYLEYAPNNPERSAEMMTRVIGNCSECKLILKKKGNEEVFNIYKNLDKTVSGKTNQILLINDIGLLCLLFKTDKNKSKTYNLMCKFAEADLSTLSYLSLLISSYLNRKEVKFIERLEQTLLPLNIKGVKQYTVKNNKDNYYRIDYYIPSLNIAIEYDENGHKEYSYEQHEGRQKYIEQELGCRFIRVTDENSDEYNIGLVIKKIFNL